MSKIQKIMRRKIQHKMHTPPLISVKMAIYNVEKYINKSIDSILNQSFTDFELFSRDHLLQ